MPNDKTVASTCPRCSSGYAEKRGDRNGKKRLHCLNCGKWYTKDLEARESYTPKVLTIDVETLPLHIRAWDLYPHYHNYNSIVEGKGPCLLSWSAKWLFDSETRGEILTPKQALARDDSGLVKSLWQEMNKADILIGHNAKKFDVRKINTRLLYHGYSPPSPYQVIDTWKTAKERFDFPSNKLDYINRYLDLNTKEDTDFELWCQCDEGDPKALKTMLSYNKNDVNILEEMYVIIRAWIPKHPNMNVYVSTEEAVCPTCGTKDIQVIGSYMTPANSYAAFRCKNCGAIGRSSHTSLWKDKRKNMVRVTE